MSLFKGIVVIDKDKYETLKTNKVLTVNGVSISYDPDTTLYVDSLFLQNITKTSQLVNDSGYITQNTITDFRVEVGPLPTSGVEKTIYFVPQEGTDTHIEYMWIGGRFETIGTTEINLDQYALKTDIPTSLPASDVYDWAKSSAKPSYTASEVGAISIDATNIVKTDVATQTINGATIFNQSIQIGGSANINENGVKITRKCTGDNNNAHEAIFKVDSDGSVKISHKNLSVNASVEDSYISFKNGKLVYATAASPGETTGIQKEIATKEYVDGAINDAIFLALRGDY